MADFSCMTLRKDGERVDLVAIRVLPICPCSFDGKSAFCRILVRVQTGAACRRVRKRLGVAGPATKESAYKVPYLKWKRSRLITGNILARGQGEPPDFRRVCTMYNSSYFQRGGANSLTLRQIARAGGDSYDC